MKNKITIIATTVLMTLSACQQNQEDPYKVDSSEYASFTCDQLKVKMDARNATIEEANKSVKNLTTANTAGLAVGLLVSPVLGAAVAADAQNRQSQAESEAKQARAEFQAMSAAGAQKGCW